MRLVEPYRKAISASPFSRRSTQENRCVLSAIATRPTSAPRAEQRIVERRMHASATGSEPSASQRVVGAEARRIEVPFADVQRPPRPADAPSWPAVDFVFVIEARRGKVAAGIRSPGLSGERVSVGAWLRERR